MSFRGKKANPLVLIGRPGVNAGLMNLHQVLAAELTKCRCSCDNKTFNSHLTLLYDRQIIQEEPVAPVAWTADEIVLVHSELGATKHNWLGRWKLQG